MILPVRALGYIRVSTAEQAASGLGLAAQRAAITEACEQRGWELVDVLVDSGLSAKGTDRPGLQEALSRLAAKPAVVDALVVAKLDRLARSFPDYADLIRVSAKEGWELLALDAPDASTPHGEAMQAIVAVFAQLERRLISDRTIEALAAARARGVQLGRRVQTSADVEARIVALHRRERLNATAIARLLEVEGVPAPRGGTRWHHETVADVIRRHGGRLKQGRPRKVRRKMRAAKNSRA
jgi:DNA invertase Pin-like site-specific DNA recombinase